jgi:hypothetical protein
MKRTIALLCLALCSIALAASGQQRLREGLLVDPPRNTAYVMTPDGGIAAVDLTSGAIRWSSSAAAKPLTLVGNRLVSQVEPKSAAEVSSLMLAVLDVERRGVPAVRSEADLPAGVRASVVETLAGTFVTRATGSGSNATITWNYIPRRGRLSGMPDVNHEDGRRAPAAAGAVNAPRSGTLRLNLGTGAMSRMTGATATATAAAPAWIIPASEIDASPSTQYESADGRHILTSERVADDPEWNKYRWTITERATGRHVGELRTHLGFSPFVVTDSVIAFETTPYILGDDRQPAKLRGFSLTNGREVWSVEVREVVYRGPMPP